MAQKAEASPPPNSAHPSHGSWPQSEGAPPKARKAERARVPATHFGTPLTRVVAPWGAPPRAAKFEHSSCRGTRPTSR
eukprot:9095864-Pyramimonas_sp.AAC.1